MLKLLSKYLTDARYEVVTADQGAEALKILHRESIAVVLSDWSMPKMTGLELCRAIRASEAIGFVYIIIITSHGDRQHVVEALEAGANDFLAKPFHPQELLARLNAGMRIISLEGDLMRQKRALHKTNAELAIANRKLEVMATTDELTGLANRRQAMTQLKAYWARGIHESQPFSCIMFDIDHFKDCNDTYGHDTGDEVLKCTAEVFRRCARKSDFVFRCGGEEFLVLCPNTDAPAAARLAEQFRVATESNAIRTEAATIQVTVSAGVAQRTVGTETWEDLLKCADRALYEVKNNGRNHVRTFGEPPPADLACQTVAASSPTR